MSFENSASEKVYDYIMEKIVSKEWGSNTKITSENNLCKELNVSRISVRQALEKLVAFGILEKRQGYGTVVNEIKPNVLLNSLVPVIALSQNDLKEILEFRIHFEYGNVLLFVEKCSEEEIEQLRENYKLMKENYHDEEKYHLHDFYFHQIISSGSKNPIIQSIGEILHSIMKYNIKQLYNDVGPDNAMNYHALILDAIEKRDASLAALLMKRHLEEALHQLENNIKGEF